MNMASLNERINAIVKRLKERIVIRSQKVEDFYYYPTCEYKIGSELPDVKEKGERFRADDQWGGVADSHAWFYKEIILPDSFDEGRIELKISTQEFADDWDAINAQFLVYVNGELRQGGDTNHRSLILDKSGVYKVHIYAYCGMKFSVKLNFFVDLLCIDEDIERLYYNLSVPAEVLALTDSNSAVWMELTKALNAGINLIDWRNDKAFSLSVKAANEYMKTQFYGMYCGKGTLNDVIVSAVGHTHIDIAWLWTRRQTDEKAQRSFANAIALMEKHPEYIFTSSQPYLYDVVKRECPALYKKIKERVKEGRWETEGAMWIEADCNLTSGESLVRQILYGKKFFKEEFGKDSKVLWLPDVFGYSAAMPQILKKSGVEYFVTSKISWNDTNTMPNDTFMWRGIDGTEIFTHFLTSQEMKKGEVCERMVTYNAMGNASYVMGAWNRYSNKELCKEALLDYGFGDGGGGSTHEHIERLKRMTYGIPGCPKVRFDTVESFLDRLKKSTEKSGFLHKWVGELYLELHRGTYTSQAKVKRNNRKAEFALQNAEWLCCMAEILTGLPYPKERFDKLWKIVLTNQFHDILPGSSIHEVYEVCNREYESVFLELKDIIASASNAIQESISMTKNEMLVFNPHSFETCGLVDGQYVQNIPGKGYKTVGKICSESHVVATKYSLENKYYFIQFAEDYRIKSIFDKRNQREVLQTGEYGNELIAYEDYPNECDAWEIRPYYKEKAYLIRDVQSTKILSDRVSAGIKIVRKYERSTIEQTIRLYDSIDRIDFETVCDWQDEHTLLKTYFPIDINTDKATFDIQFGNCERSTHHNTSWDSAKFEVCAHKYADVSEGDYGVALMTDSKYGYEVEGSVLGLSLLKAATWPDETADIGKHEFIYSLYPHKGNCRESDLERKSYLMNNPLFGIENKRGAGKLPKEWSFVSCEADGVYVETVKKAEDGNGYIFRIVEKKNRTTNCDFNFGVPPKKVYLCDLMENVLQEINTFNEYTIQYKIKPFEILTLKVNFT